MSFNPRALSPSKLPYHEIRSQEVNRGRTPATPNIPCGVSRLHIITESEGPMRKTLTAAAVLLLLAAPLLRRPVPGHGSHPGARSRTNRAALCPAWPCP
ncbi:MAG: hypothetical protein MZU79_04055 [Anaerotruncus sp.]|nr:hypothetical protein [Anaerotruncus sp.]